nr:unnamed protein product [Digitaria exilis]
MLGSSSYRVQKPLGSPIVRVLQVIVAATRKWAVRVPHDDSLLHETADENASMVDGHKLQHTPQLRFLDKAAVISSDEELSDPWRLCTVTQVEELKVIVGMLPIWATGIVYFSVLAQFSSTFLEQGRTMNTQVVGGFAIPAASLASFDAVSVIFWVPVYDRVLVPAARRLTGNARGLSELQRFGAGLFLSVMVMAAAALVETRRLAVAHAGGEVAMAMSILWQIPQYFLVGASVVFACVGQTEFFYNEAPRSMRSLCSALALLTVALGSYLSSLVVTAVAWLTTRGGGVGWIPDDLDDGHLDRFFWLLAAMSALNLAVFVGCARRYKRKNGMSAMSISASFLKGGSPPQSVVFFLGLYLMAIGAGGIKPCVSSFGADQFDDSSPAESLKKDSFFNWFFFATYTGSFVAGTVVVWVQDHYGWGFGLWLPTVFIALAIASFLLGSRKYRVQKPLGSPIVSVFQVIVASVRKWNVQLPQDDSLLHELPAKTTPMADGHKLQRTPVLRFLDKATVISPTEDPSDSNPWRLCTVTQVEELKVIIGMLPIWTTGIVFFSVLAQFSSTFLEQGRTMNKHLGAFPIPPASLASFDAVSVLIWVPVYDRALVPAARRLTGNARGLSELQRFGTGLFLSVLVMSAAAAVETRRLASAHAGDGTSSMSILWQIPQYFLVGASVVFACVGQIEFFYNEAPRSMRSLCSALALLTVGLGSYVSSVVVTAVDWLTTRGGGVGWIAEDLDDGHLDRFFWLLAAMSALNLVVFVYCARRYKCKKVF